MTEKDRQYGTKFQLVKINYIHNYIQGPVFWLKKWRKLLIYKDFRFGAPTESISEPSFLFSKVFCSSSKVTAVVPS